MRRCVLRPFASLPSESCVARLLLGDQLGQGARGRLGLHLGLGLGVRSDVRLRLRLALGLEHRRERPAYPLDRVGELRLARLGVVVADPVDLVARRVAVERVVGDLAADVAPDLADLDQAGGDQRADDLRGLVQREAAVGGEVGEGALAVDLAEHRPLAGAQHDVVGRTALRGQHGDGVRAAELGRQLVPVRAAAPQLGEQLGDRLRRGDVLPGLLVLAELAAGDVPAHEVGEHVDELLGDERLDHVAVDEAQVDEQLAQPPALQLGALDLQRLGEGLRAPASRTTSAARPAAVGGPGRRPSRRSPSRR